MSAALIIVIAIAAVVVLAALAFVTMARKSDVRGAGALSGETRRRDAAAREVRPADEVVEHPPTRAEAERAGDVARYGTRPVATAQETAVAPWSPPDPEAIGVSRRQFFNRATITLMSAGIGTFAAATFVAFLWPTAKGGFGQPVNVGKLDDIKQGIRAGQGFFYAPAARTWITAYPPDALPKAKAVYQPNILAGMTQGIVALYQKCPHLGCRVPQCVTSQWFECPCHGSQYNQVGEKKGGPAPRGMDRFPVNIGGDGSVVVQTGTVVTGPPIGTNTTGQEAEGPHCITGGGGKH